jgi:PAS domain S-box-containing protein
LRGDAVSDTGTILDAVRQAQETRRGAEGDELRRLNRTLHALRNSSHAMLHATEERELLEEVCRIVLEDCGHAMVWIGFAEHDAAKTVRPVAYAGFEAGYLDTLRLTWADSERGRGPTGTAIRTARRNVCANMRTDPRFAPWREEAIRRGYASSIALPLLADGRPMGAITIYSREPDPFSQDEQDLLAELANDLAYGITTLRLREARRRAEAALRQGEERYRSLVQLSPEGIIVTRDGRVEYVNPAALVLLGATRADEVLGRRALDLFHPDYHELILSRMRELLAGGSVPLVEERVVRLDGELRDVEVAAAAFEDQDGSAVQVVLRDVTGRRAAEAALRESDQVHRELIEALRESDERKTEFLAVLSHELRNPLAPIRNSLYVLDRAEPGGAQARRAREVMHRQTAHLARLVDDLLDVTRVSRGKVVLDRTRVDLRGVAERTCEDHRAAFDERRIALTVKLPEGPVWIDADATRISQVIGNLLHNAAKFTPEGRKVEVTLLSRAGKAVLRVRDEGIGIEAAFLARLFEPFVQAERGLARTQGGLGLGLALVKGLVELHGGSVSATSAGLDRGCELAVELPLVAAPAEAVPPAARLRAAHPRDVLVIEDYADSAQALADALALCGHRVRVAGSAAEGLALAKDSAPEVVLCDIGLPDLDGYEVARALRADPALRATVLVALSGYAQAEDKDRAAEAGFDAHVSKPASLEALAELFDGLGTGKRSPTASPRSP